MSNALTLWTIYDHPADFPSSYVARQWLVFPEGPVPTESAIAGDLPNIRLFMEGMGLFPLPRTLDDDPVIVEVWL